MQTRKHYNTIEFKLQDVILTPEIYETPVQQAIKDITCPVFSGLYQMIYSDVQKTILETDLDYTGLNLNQNVKTEKYLKYDSSLIITIPSGIINTNGEVIELVTQLSSKVLTTKRQYVKLIDVLGDVGGFMEIIFFILNTMTSFISNSLYEKSLVKNLFLTDLANNQSSINHRKN